MNKKLNDLFEKTVEEEVKSRVDNILVNNIEMEKVAEILKSVSEGLMTAYAAHMKACKELDKILPNDLKGILTEHRNQRGTPFRSGEPWSTEEEIQLINMLHTTMDEFANKCGRSYGAIRSKAKKIFIQE